MVSTPRAREPCDEQKSEVLFLQRYGQSVANRENRRVELLRIVKLPIELKDGFGARVGRVLLGNPPAPQHIVRDKEPALAEARSHQAQDARVIVFVDIVENDVEFLLLLRKIFQ